DAAGAVAHLAPRATLTPVAPAQALAWLQWCGASGGAHGHRRGGAAGRFAAWWAAAALAGLSWPSRAGLDDDFAAALGGALDDLRWYRWSPGGPAARAGWRLHLAVHDPVDGLAWAVGAYDRHADDATAVRRRDP
ncbi:MAG TPA: hypothetical protein VK891_06420, partial [Euzebyales bacterium]|nr:hypothetical protein [Euzebyales bacterium]